MRMLIGMRGTGISSKVPRQACGSYWFLSEAHNLAYFESAGEVSYGLVVQTIQGDRLFANGRLDAAIAMFKDVVARAVEHQDWDLVRGARTSLAEILFKAGQHFEAREVLDLVDAAEWGENNLELKRLEEVKNLMLDTMSMMLNIEVKR
jgi:hypothetical protein